MCHQDRLNKRFDHRKNKSQLHSLNKKFDLYLRYTFQQHSLNKKWHQKHYMFPLDRMNK
jgi:hypothetical protein